MFLLVFIKFGLLLQETSPVITDPPGGNWFQYGLAGALIILMGLILKYIMQRDQRDKEREDKRIEQENAREERLAKQRSEMYREDNKIRDERWIKTMEGMTKSLEKVDTDGSKFIDATKETIEMFTGLVNKVMDQSNYQTQVLTELKTLITKLPSEFAAEKKEIIEHLKMIGVNYELKKKD